MNPYEVLGVPNNATIDVVRVAWRSLRSKLHPDHGGSEDKFKAAKDAFDLIEAGYQVKVAPPPRPAPAPSSFGTQASLQPRHVFKPKGPVGPPLPATIRSGRGNSFSVTINVSREQARVGGTVPFMHQGEVRHFIVRPNDFSREVLTEFPAAAVIGQNFGSYHTILIRLIVS